jgi:hypothetical protein
VEEVRGRKGEEKRTDLARVEETAELDGIGSAVDGDEQERGR